MKKFYISVLFILTLVAAYGQKSHFDEKGESFTLDQHLPGYNSYDYTASEFVKLTNDRKSAFDYVPIPGMSFHAIADPQLVFPPEEGEFGGASNNNEGGVVGTIRGTLNLGANGEAVYHIPIEVPPGVNKMAPTIGLTYNSRVGNRILGIGWSISGLSAISRMGTDLYHEDSIAGIDFDDNDKLALDGNRLIPIENGQYRTEIETFSKIIPKDIVDGWPAWFEVYTKDGRIIEYGNTTDSRIEPYGSTEVLSWNINKISDRKGNYIKFSYVEEYGYGRILEIKYSDDGNGTPQNVMKFHYTATRPDTITNYLSGTTIQITTLLDSIEVLYNNAAIQTYDIDYGFDGFYSAINSITLWDEGKVKCFNPTLFEWGEPAPEAFSLESTNIENEDYSTSHTIGDFNGDGKSDVACAYYIYNGNGDKEYKYWDVYYANASSMGFIQQFMDSLNPQDLGQFISGDFNGDGLDDLIKISVSAYNITAYYFFSNGMGFDTGPSKFISAGDFHCRTGDFNGNGITDFVVVRNIMDARNLRALEYDPASMQLKEIINCNYNLGQDPGLNDINVADFNGDGRSDILVNTSESTSIIYEYDYAEVSTPVIDEISEQLSELYVGDGFPTKNHSVFTGDFNGDGISDILTYTSNDGWALHYFNGKDELIQGNCPVMRNSNPEDPDNNYHVIISDYNGDGKSDILEIFPKWENNILIGTYVRCHYSRGLSFVTETRLFDQLFLHSSAVFPHFDFNGDGNSDCLLSTGSNSNPREIMYFSKDEEKNRIHRITNGLGAVSKLSYEPLTNSEIYTKDTEIQDKIQNIQNAIYVIDTLSVDDGLGGWFVNTYQYEGAKVHLEGKGFLGFKKITSSNLSTGVNTVISNQINTTYYYPYLKYKKTLVAGELLVETEYDNTAHHFGNQRIFVYNNLSLTNVHSTGDEASTYVKTIRNQKYYSASDIVYGNITSNKTFTDKQNYSLSVPSAVYDFYTESGYIYNYTNIDDWLISRPSKKTVKKKSPDDNDEFVQDSDFEYYPQSDPLAQYPLLKTLSSTPNNQSSFMVQRTYQYDSYGNVIKETITTPNYSIYPVQARITEFEYSPDYQHRFLTRVKKTENNIDFFQYNRYNAATGLLKYSIDINDDTTHYTYDGFGRLINTTYPNGVRTGNALRWNSLTEPQDAVYYQWQKTSGQPPVLAFMDKLGREHRSTTMSFDDKTIIRNKFYYAQSEVGHGKLFKETESFFANDDYLENEYQWLPTGQVKKHISPAGTIQITYNGRATSTHNLTTGLSKTQTVNAIGQMILASDPSGTVQYKYKSHGQPYQIINGAGFEQSLIDIWYDDAGFKDGMSDPDAGDFSYDYNPLGELMSETNARSYTYEMQYDALGRIIQKKLLEPEQITTYNYDDENALGQISTITGHNGISNTWQYDELSRLIKKTETIELQQYTFDYQYDVYGRLKQETWPSGFAVDYKYRNGYLYRVKQHNNQKTLWKLNDMNARGQIEQFVLGNGLTSSQSYDQYGFPQTITTSNNVQNLSFQFDYQTGNLEWRKDLKILNNPTDDLIETFGYDGDKLKSRLISWQLSGGQAYGIEYLDNGNIDQKTDVGNYLYNVGGSTGGPHAVSKVINAQAEYVQNAPPQYVNYTPFDKVNTISHP